MATNGPRISAYCYSEATVSDTAAPTLDANSGMATIEATAPATTTYGRPLAPELFEDQLDTIRAGWDLDAPYGLYSFGYDDATERVTVDTQNAKNFRPQMPGNSAAWFGFTQDLGAGAGYDAEWTGDDAPAGISELFAVEVEPAEDMARVDLAEYRHGRAVATVWGNRQVHRVLLTFRVGNRAQIEAGYLTSGRVRIWQCGDGTAYSPTNVDGYVDGWVVAAGDITEDGDVGGLWSIRLVVGIAR